MLIIVIITEIPKPKIQNPKHIKRKRERNQTQKPKPLDRLESKKVELRERERERKKRVAAAKSYLVRRCTRATATKSAMSCGGNGRRLAWLETTIGLERNSEKRDRKGKIA